jgi:phasin family protein
LRFQQEQRRPGAKLANATFVGFEQLINLNLAAAKNAFDVSTTNFKALSEITDVQDYVAFRTKVAELGVENALAYSREAYEVFSGTQAEVSKVFEASVTTLNKNLASVVDKAVKSAPARFRRRRHGAQVHDGCHDGRDREHDQGHPPGRRLHRRVGPALPAPRPRRLRRPPRSRPRRLRNPRNRLNESPPARNQCAWSDERLVR